MAINFGKNRKERELVTNVIFDMLSKWGKDKILNIKLDIKNFKNISSEVERGCYNYAINICKENCIRNSWEHYQFIEIYSEGCYRIIRELDPEINKFLVPSLLSGQLSPCNLPLMKDNSLNPNGTLREEEEISIRSQQKVEKKFSKTVTCGRCQGKKVEYREIQMRSADEPSTLKYTCNDCHHTWSRTG